MVRGAWVAACIAAVAAPVPAVSQSRLRARVIDSEVGRPVAGATVQVGKTAPPLITDSLGRFETPSLPPGRVEVTLKAVGYAPGSYQVQLPDSGTLQAVFALEFTGYQLPEVVVEARAEQLMPRYADFERRRQQHVGAFFRWDELKKQGYASIGDALRTVRGVRIVCNQQEFECNAVMVRTPQCTPTWFVDGTEVRSFHESTPIRDVYGIEVYRGAGEIPAEFAGSNAACGVIVVWTKSRPYVPSRP